MDYTKKLQDPRWQRKRLEIFQRDAWKSGLGYKQVMEILPDGKSTG